MFRLMFCFVLIAAPQLFGQRVLFQCPLSGVTVAEGINNSGTVVGYNILTQGGGSHAFIYSGGGCSSFDVPSATNTVAMAINNSGTISGYYTDAVGLHGFLRSAGGIVTTFDNPTTTSNTVGLDINTAGTVIVDSNSGVFLRSATAVYTPVTFSHPFVNFSKMGINDSSPMVIVGTVGTTQNPGCFIDSGGSSTAFSVPGALSTQCFDVNNTGSIAGAYFTNEGQFAFVRVGSITTTLQGLPGASANGLNDIGQIVGAYTAGNGVIAAFITSGIGSVRGGGDFDGNGVPDLVWQNDSTRQVAVWYMGGTSGAQFQSFGWLNQNSVLGWSVATVADLNRDGVPDLIWQNDTTGQVVVYYMGGPNGATILSLAWISMDNLTQWKVVGAADLNADGVPDLIFQNTSTGQVGAWLMGGAQGNQFQAYLGLAQAPAGWNVVGMADLDGDGHPDLVFQNGSGQVVAWYMGGAQGNVVVNYVWLQINTNTPTWKVVGLVDLDGNGSPDLIWQENTSREVVAWYMGGALGSIAQSFAALQPNPIPGWRALMAH